MSMDREQKIAEIREGLEKATPGPWEIANTTDGYGLLYANGRVLAFLDSIGRADDARFIANAPEWLQFLLSEIEHLEREYAEERAAHKAHVAQLCRVEEDNRKRFVKIAELVSERERLTKENRKLREERDKLIEGLRWYGKTSRYSFRRNGSVDVLADSGQRARDALKEIGVTVE